MVFSSTIFPWNLHADTAAQLIMKIYSRNDTFKSNISGEGTKVTYAASGEGAVKYLKEHKVDLLVLDIIMDPGMDGLKHTGASSKSIQNKSNYRQRFFGIRLGT